MTDATATAQLLDGAPTGTSIRVFSDTRTGDTVVIATVNGHAFELGRIEQSVHYDPREFSVDWPAVLRTIPAKAAP